METQTTDIDIELFFLLGQKGFKDKTQKIIMCFSNDQL